MVKNNFYLISLAVIVLDQLTKFFAENYLVNPISIIKNIFSLTLVHNTGAAFGILQGYKWVFIWLAVIIIGFILFYWDKIKTNTEKTLIALIAGGIIGNFIDRVIFSYTIDFLDFHIWPAFNIADSCMTIGAIGLIMFIWKK